MGLEGTFVKAVVTQPLSSAPTYGTQHGLQFELVDSSRSSFDTILRTLVQDLLELPTCVARVRRFVGEHLPGYEYGEYYDQE